MLLTTLGIASMAFVAAFTIYTYSNAPIEPFSGQSRRSALAEAWLNVGVGFSVNYLANIAILPLVGLHVTLGQNFWLGCIYTAISVLRSYAIRRWFNARIVALARRIAA